MPKRRKTTRPIPGTPAARREPVTVLVDSVRGGSTWTHTLLPFIAAEARERGWRMLNTQGVLARGLPDVPLHGALVQFLPDSEMAAVLKKRGCPAVRLGRFPHPRDVDLPAVLPDLAAQGRAAAEHFAERRFRQVGYVSHAEAQHARPLHESLHATAEERGMTFHLLRFPRAEPGESGEARYNRRQALVAARLGEVPKPFGLLTQGDGMAVDLVFRLQMAGLSVPSDVAVLGHGNDVLLCESTMPTLSSIDTNERGRVRAACDLLAGLMAGEPPPEAPLMVPPAGVVVRESTDVLATPDPDVTATLRYLWAHLDLDLPVDHVAREVGVPRRRLERAFRRHLGRGINAELRRKRLETLAELLRATDHAISALAPQVGFRTLVHLQRSFKAAYGCTPSQYRKSAKARGAPATQ